MKTNERAREVDGRSLKNALFMTGSIGLLLDQLDEAEVQRRRSQGSHVETVDRILADYRSKIRGVEDRYRRNVCEELAQDRLLREEIEQRQRGDQGLLRSLVLAMRQRFSDLLSAAQGDTMSKVDSWAEERKNLRELAATELDNKFQSMQRDLKQVLVDHENDTRDKRVAHESLKEKHERETRTIDEQTAHIASLFEKIREIHEKMRECQDRAEKETVDLRSELDFFVKAHRDMNNRFLSGKALDRAQLMTMTLEYNRTVERLSSIVTKGRQLLTFVQSCRKFQTEDEKILSFAFKAEDEELQVNLKRSIVIPEWEKTQSIAQDLQCLENFWRRLGEAQIIRDQLAAEKEKLQSEKNDLQERLRLYMLQQSPKF